MEACCSDNVPGACPSIRIRVGWEHWMVTHMLLPFAALVILTAFFLVVGPLYRRSCTRGSSYISWLFRTYIGNRDRPTQNPELLITAFSIEMAASFVTLIVWIVQAHRRRTLLEFRGPLLVATAVQLVNWVLLQIRGECRLDGLWRISSLVDAVTVGPVLGKFWWGISATIVRQCAETEDLQSDADWLSLQFLRSCSMLFAFKRIQNLSNYLQHNYVFAQILVDLVLHLISLIFVMAGTIFLSELIVPPFSVEGFVETPGGDQISILQMIYWVVISIMTVGYGDFAPRTLISRILTVGFIVYGVVYVYWLQNKFTHAWSELKEGSGVYRVPGNTNTGHVVVVLCSQSQPSSFSSLVAGFLREILHSSQSQEWPDVVIYARTQWEVSSEEPVQQRSRGTAFDHRKSVCTFEDFLSSEGFSADIRRHVFFIVGETTSMKDLNRASMGSSAMTFLLSDVQSPRPDEADEDNIFSAIMIRKHFPTARLRLLLLRPQSKELAVQAGMEIARCFSLRELKANILAQNVRCHGMVPMITGLLKSVKNTGNAQRLMMKQNSRQSVVAHAEITHTIKHPEGKRGGGTDRLSAQARTDPADAWMTEYLQGMENSVHGFELSEDYADLSFGKLVCAVWKDTGAVLVAVLRAGRIQICPNGKVSAHQICFAITANSKALDPCRAKRHQPEDWRDRLNRIGDMQLQKSRIRGPHVEAARLMGPHLREFQKHGNSVTMQLLRQCSNEDRKDHLSIDGTHDPVARTSTVEPSLRTQTTPSDSSCGPTLLASKPAAFKLPKPLESDDEGHDNEGSICSTNTCLSSITESFPENTIMQMAAGGSTGMSSFGNELLDGELSEQVNTPHELRTKSAATSELVVLIVCNGEVWQQVRSFVSSLRAGYLPTFKPIVVFAPSQPPERLFDGCSEGVMVFEGNYTKTRALFEAGILEASAIVVMSGEVPQTDFGREAIFRDSRVALCAQVLECWCGLSKSEVFTTYEMLDSASVKSLPSLIRKPSIEVDELLARSAESWAEADETDTMCNSNVSTQSAVYSSMHSTGSWRALQDPGSHGSHGEDDRGNTALFHPRFAAGQIFTPELWGAMLGRMFHMPAIVDLIEALVMPDRRGQTSFPWQILVPPQYIGRSFSELLWDLGRGMSMESHGRSSRRDGQYSDNRRPKYGCAVAVALYRRREELRFGKRESVAEVSAQGTGGYNYTFLAPPPHTVLCAVDRVLVLGSAGFGEAMYHLGLLRGSCQQLKQNVKV